MKTIEPIRVEKESEAKLIAGINKHYLNGAAEEIPRQWEQFNAKSSLIPNRKGPVTYGVCFTSPEKGGIRYLCGIEVTDFGDLPSCSAIRHCHPTAMRYLAMMSMSPASERPSMPFGTIGTLKPAGK